MNYRKSEAKVNAIVNEVLDENREDAAQSQDCPNDCEGSQSTPKEIPWQCKCGIETSSRFSLRVMEAMRALQRDVDQPPTSSAEDIVDYIRANYRNDGDLYAQVRTALRQICLGVIEKRVPPGRSCCQYKTEIWMLPRLRRSRGSINDGRYFEKKRQQQSRKRIAASNSTNDVRGIDRRKRQRRSWRRGGIRSSTRPTT
ncbi:uncharacterized protein LOC109852301 [Pseudomyrmex gracilis]|uniref:uncharacterized protein LOC109852301 n=1 Tax=Pseudomyrmex gracilis TaxID=219809 RepID=UPI000994B82B|nr:uncharacterized protein LOC109852301 [Pseudomyrmex gracilis]